MSIEIRIGAAIRKSRLSSGYSQDGLAIIAGMTRGYISKVENDRVCPDLRQIVRIAVALEVDPCRIIRDALDTVQSQVPVSAVIRATVLQ